jgi:hypothetical protein
MSISDETGHLRCYDAAFAAMNPHALTDLLILRCVQGGDDD